MEFILNPISAEGDIRREDQVLCRDEQGQGYSHKDPIPVAQECFGLPCSSGTAGQCVPAQGQLKAFIRNFTELSLDALAPAQKGRLDADLCFRS